LQQSELSWPFDAGTANQHKGYGTSYTNKVLQHPSDVTHQISVQDQPIMQQGIQINLAPKKRALPTSELSWPFAAGTANQQKGCGTSYYQQGVAAY